MPGKIKSLTVRSAVARTRKASARANLLLFRRADDLPWKTDSAELPQLKFPVTEKDLVHFRRSADLEKCKLLSDSELIQVIHKQNPEAYKELFARYQKKLFTYIFHLVGNKDETEDILQNVFSKTYRNIEHFDIERKFSSWIYRIAHNESVNFLKRKSKRYTVSWDDISTSKDKLDTASSDELPEEKWVHEEITRAIDLALEKLPKKYQKVLKLRYFDEYSYDDISKILDKPVNTVGTLINRAKKKLLEVVKEEGLDEQIK